MRHSCTSGAPAIQAIMTLKLLVLLAALTFALAQETTAQSGPSLEGVTVSDLGDPNDSLFKVPAGGAVPPGSYVLDVASGSGDGIYPTGRRVKVSADAPPAGQKFAGWTGDITILSNPFLPTTTAIIPSMDVSLSATYADPEGAAGSGPWSVATGERETAVALIASPSPSPTPQDGCKAEIDEDVLFELLTTVIQAGPQKIRPFENSEHTDINYKVTATFSASGAWTGTLNVQITRKFSVTGPNLPPGGKIVVAPIHEKPVTVSGAAGETKSVANQDSIRVSALDAEQKWTNCLSFISICL
jgi:List-Bact-rpt repeat protein